MGFVFIVQRLKSRGQQGDLIRFHCSEFKFRVSEGAMDFDFIVRSSNFE